MALVDMLLPEFDHEMATTRKLLERVPDDRLRLEAARQVVHARAAGTARRHDPEVGHDDAHHDRAGPRRAAPQIRRPRRRAALLKLFDDNAANARTALAGKTDAELMAPWALKRGADTIFSMPKASVWRSFVMNHLVHHRGAAERVPAACRTCRCPPMYGPTADEQAF